MGNINIQQYKNSLLRQRARDLEEMDTSYVERLKEVKDDVELALKLNSKSALSDAYCELNKIINEMEGK